jgi:hypothetical protein
MTDTMSQFKVTANSHMRRDIQAGGKWVCMCEACQGIRSLVGLEKMLGVRPLVRELEATADRLQTLPDGPEKRSLLEHYLKLHDNLADEMAK